MFDARNGASAIFRFVSFRLFVCWLLLLLLNSVNLFPSLSPHFHWLQYQPGLVVVMTVVFVCVCSSSRIAINSFRIIFIDCCDWKFVHWFKFSNLHTYFSFSPNWFSSSRIRHLFVCIAMSYVLHIEHYIYYIVCLLLCGCWLYYYYYDDSQLCCLCHAPRQPQ